MTKFKEIRDNCFILPNGECVSPFPCVHGEPCGETIDAIIRHYERKSGVKITRFLKEFPGGEIEVAQFNFHFKTDMSDGQPVWFNQRKFRIIRSARDVNTSKGTDTMKHYVIEESF